MGWVAFMIAAGASVGATDLDFIDSRDNPKMSYVCINSNCCAKVPKNKVSDVCFVLKEVIKQCKLDLDGCDENK